MVDARGRGDIAGAGANGIQAGITRTGADGRFEVPDLASGAYLAIFSCIGYHPHATMVVPGLAAAPLDVILDPATSIRGVVYDRHSEQPVAAVTVTAVGPGGEVIASTVSDPDGGYVITGIDATEITLVVVAAGADPVATVVRCGNGTEYQVDLPLDTYSSLGGMVTEDGVPVAHLRLTLRHSNGSVAATTFTDAHGAYRFVRLKADQYVLDSATSGPGAITIAPDTTTADLALVPWGTDPSAAQSLSPLDNGQSSWPRA
ncbi:collagen binding domain-containing protein [Nocardia sp. 2YAB30]|uniref:MSCRAMM family protein n=1 Tax=unclassified Nocardia TaxID=2637762 RepID=UPI003F9D0102